MLVDATPDQAQHRFLERVGETLVGVAVALVLGVVIPKRRRRTVEGPSR